MKKFSGGQCRVMAEVFGNMAVAWFSGGVISPILLHNRDLVEITVSALGSLVVAGFFIWLALSFAKRLRL